MGTLFLVATPIGNLEDITRRALDTLRRVDLIAAEDTRRTAVLLTHYEVKTPLTSYHEHNKQRKLSILLQALETGAVALVSDAGTPALSDPGYELVRAAWEAGHQVTPIPGPAAPIAALVASGLPTDRFLYLGYLPRKRSTRRQEIQKVADLPYTLLFLEAPHRLVAALEDLETVLGEREIAVARELTKLHEEIFIGTIRAACEHFRETAPRGEITLVVAGCEAGRAEEKRRWTEDELHARLNALADLNQPATKIAREIAAESGWGRREIYERLVTLRQTRDH